MTISRTHFCPLIHGKLGTWQISEGNILATEIGLNNLSFNFQEHLKPCISGWFKLKLPVYTIPLPILPTDICAWLSGESEHEWIWLNHSSLCITFQLDPMSYSDELNIFKDWEKSGQREGLLTVNAAVKRNLHYTIANTVLAKAFEQWLLLSLLGESILDMTSPNEFGIKFLRPL